MTEKRDYLICRGCGKQTPNDGPIHSYCSIECALWSRVSKRGEDECWPFTGATDQHGYGHFSWGTRKLVKAHRISYEVTHGSPGEFHILHKCDNPNCCNPNHLFAGTHADNMRDRDAKNRNVVAGYTYRKGIKNHMAKLTEEQVIDIRARWAKGERREDLAQTHSVTLSNINQIVYRFTWRHI